MIDVETEEVLFGNPGWEGIVRSGIARAEAVLREHGAEGFLSIDGMKEKWGVLRIAWTLQYPEEDPRMPADDGGLGDELSWVFRGMEAESGRVCRFCGGFEAKPRGPFAGFSCDACEAERGRK